MSRKKAVICTILFIIILVAVWTVIGFTNEKLTRVIAYLVTGRYMANCTEKFYNWLMKDSSKEE